MSPIAILTDSSASLPEALLKELNIKTVAYYIHRGQEVLRDLVTIQRDEFIRWLENAKVLPKSASPGPGDYIEAYQELVEQGATEIVSIHMTSTASGAYQAAQVAQSMAQEQMPQVKIQVIDTRNTALCQGWIVVEAARLARAGKSLEEIVTKIKNMIPVTRMILTADTLKYLYLGGRIGKAQRLVGSLLSIKPLIGMEDGVIVPLGTERSRPKAYQAMVALVEQAVGKAGRIKVAYVHAGALEEAKKIRDLIEASLTVVESMFAELSPALALHSGPGTVGVCYYPVE